MTFTNVVEINNYIILIYNFVTFTQASTAIKNKPLSTINKALVSAVTDLRSVTNAERVCLKELSECSELINWVRKQIQGNDSAILSSCLRSPVNYKVLKTSDTPQRFFYLFICLFIYLFVFN